MSTTNANSATLPSMRRGSSLRASTSTVDTARQYIQRLAVLYDEDVETTCDIDGQRLHHALKEILETVGPTIAMVEVYRYRDRMGDLEWLGGINRHGDDDKAIKKPDPVLAGAGLIGTLWAAAQTSNSTLVNRMTTSGSFGRLRSSGSSSNFLHLRGSVNGRHSSTTIQQYSHDAETEDTKTPEVAATKAIHHLQCRDLKSIHMDPDTWQCPRIQDHVQKGLVCKAAGECFESDGIQGLVVYYATPNHEDGLPQTVFLRRCVSYIGSMIAMSEARKAYCCLQDQQQQIQLTENNKDANEDELKESSQRMSTFETEASVESFPDNPTCIDRVRARFMTWYHKCRGGGLQIPPAMEMEQVVWTWFGAFCGLLLLSIIDQLFVHLTENEYQLAIGPFGAMMTLLYALPSAPASQPRNVILGEAIAGAVAMALSYLPLPQWVRRAVSPAFGIAAMTACGVVHPPAGAHATIWADQKHNWGHYAIVVLCSAVSVIPAMIINNMSVKRQYPMYWGYLPKWLYHKVFGCMNEEERKKKERVRKRNEQVISKKMSETSCNASEANDDSICVR